MRTKGRRAPYADEADRRARKLMTPPKDLLGWFLTSYREEMPERLHVQGVWVDRVSEPERDVGIRPVGGSLMGSPQTAGTFRRLTEDSPFATEVASYDGHKDRSNHYVFPLRAALARLAGRGRDDEPYPFMARALLTTARLDGDWDRALSLLGVHPPAVRRVYLETALRLVYEKYEVEPLARAS